MRHCNPTTNNYFTGHTVCHTSPYCMPYTYEKASPERSYIKVLEFVSANPKCKRIDIIKGVWNHDDKFTNRGYRSMLFANMLYDNLIDYNKKYEYVITEKGLELLRKCGGSQNTAFKNNVREDKITLILSKVSEICDYAIVHACTNQTQFNELENMLYEAVS